MIIKAAKSSFRDDYTQYSAHFQAQRPDIVLCDHLNDPCIRAADENKIPLIETSTMAPFKGGRQSKTTTLNIPLWPKSFL